MQSRFKKVLNAVSAVQILGHGSRTFKFDAGAEPGIDVDKVELDLDAEAHVTIVDYSRDRYTLNDDLDLEEAFEQIRKPRPTWSKCRWINVQGLSWKILKELAHQYELHPLAIEDVVSLQRTKADHYKNHSYMCITRHVLADAGYDKETNMPKIEKDTNPIQSLWTTWRDTRREEEQLEAEEAYAAAGDLGPSATNVGIGSADQYFYRNKQLVYDAHQRLRTSNLSIAVEQVSMFLTLDGTLITFFQVRL